MRFRTKIAPPVTRIAIAGALAALVATPAGAQDWPHQSSEAIGEKYHVELSGSLWNPSVYGVISSDQFGIIGSDIDFTRDLKFEQTRFKDLRFVVRPAKKHKFKFQYTPMSYTSTTTFQRNIVFNGILYPVSVPVTSEFDWTVMRLGYEYDFVYTSRGYVGVLAEGRFTKFNASLKSPIAAEYTSARAPLPALGVVTRAYPVKALAINFDLSMFRIPDVDPKYSGNYYDWDLNGTVNLSNYFGIQVGWRKISTVLGIEDNHGDLKFQGMWFGAAVRY